MDYIRGIANIERYLATLSLWTYSSFFPIFYNTYYNVTGTVKRGVMFDPTKDKCNFTRSEPSLHAKFYVHNVNIIIKYKSEL